MVILDILDPRRILASAEARSSLFEQIWDCQFEDSKICFVHDQVLSGESERNTLDSEAVIRFDGRVCVSRIDELIHLILCEDQNSWYSIHPEIAKMYRNLRQHYWWSDIMRDVVDFIARCLFCQLVKVEHQRPGGLTQRLPNFKWKWERITMNFYSGLPHTSYGSDGIWVIRDCLTKSIVIPLEFLVQFSP